MALLFGFRQVLYSLFKKGLSPNREAGGFFDGFIYYYQPGWSVFNMCIGDALPYNGVVKWDRRERLENI
jgi:hypothetical protein